LKSRDGILRLAAIVFINYLQPGLDCRREFFKSQRYGIFLAIAVAGVFAGKRGDYPDFDWGGELNAQQGASAVARSAIAK